MVKNNIEVDVKVKCIEQGKTQVQLAEEIDTTKAYVNRVIKKQDGVVNKTFVQMMEALGYDIELTACLCILFYCCLSKIRIYRKLIDDSNCHILIHIRNQ